jgi:ribonuclease T2
MKFAALVLFVCAWLAPALAQVKRDGTFAAAKACPALASIKRNSNPDNAFVEPGQSYKLLGQNRADATHYWIEMPGVEPAQRWVAIECGSFTGEASAAVKSSHGTPARKGQDGFYILALSWEPAFCESMPGKPECKFASPDNHDAQNLSLHGLWPQPRSNVYCNVDPATVALDENHRWEKLPRPELTQATQHALDKVMPGTKSKLERHEWIKHGTCFPGGAEAYFRESVRLTEEINQSAVQDFLVANIGKRIETRDLIAAFDRAFGVEAGQRVRVACKDDGGRLLISELTIGLRGDVADGTSLSELMMASTPTDPGCRSGIVDPAGRQ